MKPSSLALLAGCVSHIHAHAANNTTDPAQAAVSNQPIFTPSLLFPIDTKLTKHEINVLDDITKNLVDAQYTIVAKNPTTYPLFRESINSWNRLRSYLDHYKYIERRHLDAPMDKLETALVNIIVRYPTKDNKKACGAVLRDIMSFTGFLCHAFRGQGKDIPLYIMELPSRLFGILFRFVAYDVREDPGEITMPMAPGIGTLDWMYEHIQYDPPRSPRRSN